MDEDRLRECRSAAVTFTGSGVTGRWDPSMDSILAFAEAHGLNPDFTCRTGTCHTCECTLVAGEVEYVIEPLDPPEPGRVLICCSRPTTDVVIEV